MITITDAFNIIKEQKPDNKTIEFYELPTRYSFVSIPKSADERSYICACTFVNKKDGSISYGYPTNEEMKHAKRPTGQM